jgi:uncharacterized protein (DUF362 family)
MKRRDFLKTSILVSSSIYFPFLINSKNVLANSVVVKVHGDSPYKITKRAIKELGGMQKIISKQDIVMIKPNIGWNRTIEQAANTNPMAKKMGVELRYTDNNRLVAYDFKGEKLKKWPVFKDFLEVDKFINVPILKHHGSAELTIGMKNLIGIVGGRRGKLHRDLGMNIADLAYGFKTHLTIVDSFRILKRNGPVGGRISDVELKKTVIASTNIMEADVIAADLFGEKPEEIPFIKFAFEKKMGNMDISKINLKSFAA